MLVCRVLGSTEVLVDGVAVPLGGPRPRRLITALIAAANQPVSDDRLADAVWGAQSPGQSSAALQVYVSRLRAALGSAGRESLRRSGSGYLLRLPDDATDVDRFVRDIGIGRELLAEGRPEAALRTLADALELWRGAPFAELPPSDEIDATRGRLVELHAVAVEERLAAQLAAGDAVGAVTELDAAVLATPYRERRWALLVLALYRSGRQADALASLRRVRALLAGELGVDPGPELQELEQRVLGQDAGLLLAEPSKARPRKVGRPLSSFVGRDSELRVLGKTLAQQRLVTVVGPGGVGKTRLAVEYAADRTDTDGPWFVRFADVRQAEVVVLAVAEAIGVADLSSDPLATLLRSVEGRTGLLVIDNCEHLVEPVAELVVRLLEHGRDLRVLATSREPLGIDGEAVLALEPLATHEEDGSDGPAVRLLFDRVSALRPNWTPAEDDHDHARQVCQALDGLPLALELAAARARVLGLGEIVERLGNRFAVLGPVPRGSLTAHPSLHAAIGWSVEQLSVADRALLTRLWPFEGGFSLAAAEAVATTDSSTIDSLSTLVSRSVVTADTTMTPTRYRLLESLRAYCQEHDPDPAATRAGHAAWCRGLVGQHAPELQTLRGGYAMRVFARELPNIRACLSHDLEHDPNAALRTVGLLNWFWVRGGHSTDAARFVRKALSAADADAPVADRVRALMTAGTAAVMAYQDPAESLGRYSEAISLVADSAEHEHQVLYGQVLHECALCLFGMDQPDIALIAARRSVEVARKVEVDWLISAALGTVGVTMVFLGQIDDGQAILVEAAQLGEQALNWDGALAYLGLSCAFLIKARDSADPVGHGWQAVAALRQSLRLYQLEEDHVYSLAVLSCGAHALAFAGASAAALRLDIAARWHFQRLGVPNFLCTFTDSLELAPLLSKDLGSRDRTAIEEAEVLDWAGMLALFGSAAPS